MTIPSYLTPARLAPQSRGTAPLQGALKVIAIYDSFGDGIRVREAASTLGEIVGPHMTVFHQGWSFRSLAALHTRSAAVHAAEGADVLMVAADPSLPLPGHVVSWLERCLVDNHSRPAMLVTLHDDDERFDFSAVPLAAQLRRIASQWGMEYVANHELEDRVNGLAAAPAGSRGTGALAGVGGPRFESFAAWYGGINE